MMSRQQQVITREENANNVYSDVNNLSATTNSISSEDQLLLENIQRKLGVYTQNSYVDVDESSDVKPSQSTLTMTYKRDYAQTSTTYVASQAKLSTKSKVAIASYVAVVLVLVLAVALCAASINGSFTAVLQGQDAYNQVSDELAALQEQINNEDYQELMQKAEEMGFVQADTTNSNNYTKLETRSAQNFTVETNWFDQVCNWISGVFGG